MNTIKVNELFTGIGAFRKAMINTKIPYEIVGISEIDKNAIKSYTAIYGETKNYGDISKIEKLDYADLWTYGFPCQDISNAGLQKGIIKGTTRSGLLYEVERLLYKAKEDGELPKVLIMENVKGLLQKKFSEPFNAWIKALDELGYYNYYQVLNASHYGSFQARERVFMVSIRKDLVYADKFSFPKEKKQEHYNLFNIVEKNYDNLSVDEQKTIRLTQPELDRIGKFGFAGKWYKEDTPYNTITANYSKSAGYSMKFYRNSKNGNVATILTPKEAWLLMGFSEEDFYKAEKVCTSNQLYRQAGNSISVEVLEAILGQVLMVFE